MAYALALTAALLFFVVIFLLNSLMPVLVQALLGLGL